MTEFHAVSYCENCEVKWNPDYETLCWVCGGEGSGPRGPETEEERADELLLRLTRLVAVRA